MMVVNPHNLENDPRLSQILSKLITKCKSVDVTFPHQPLQVPTSEDRDYWVSNDQLFQTKSSQPNEFRAANNHLYPVTGIDEYTNKVVGVLWELYPTHSIHCTGKFLYPDTGFMGWHTNADVLGYRIYMTHTEVAGESAFLYYDDITNQIVWDYDKAGWTIRLFDTSSYERPLWHAVWSNTTRYSFGFTIIDLP